MATVNSYDALYANMKNRLTVVNNDSEYTIGDYMLMRARKQEESKKALAAKTAVVPAEQTMAQVVSFISDKLTIKEAPIKDKTIRAFPFRASASAFLAAAVACSLMLSFVTIGARLIEGAPQATEVSLSEEIEENIQSA